MSSSNPIHHTKQQPYKRLYHHSFLIKLENPNKTLQKESVNIWTRDRRDICLLIILYPRMRLRSGPSWSKISISCSGLCSWAFWFSSIDSDSANATESILTTLSCLPGGPSQVRFHPRALCFHRCCDKGCRLSGERPHSTEVGVAPEVQNLAQDQTVAVSQDVFERC